MVGMERLDAERVVSELRRRLEDGRSSDRDKTEFTSERLSDALNAGALQTGGALLTRLKTRLFQSGVLEQCVALLHPKRLAGGGAAAAAALARVLSSCCVGVEPGDQSEAFDRLLLPSVMSALLSLAARLLKQKEDLSLIRTVLDSAGWLLQTHHHLAPHVLSSVAYEQLQVSEDSSVSLLCVQLWSQALSTRDFADGLSDDSVTLLLNDAVGQLAVSSEAAVGGASVRLLLLLARQRKARLLPLLRPFRGLDRLLDNDWRGRGFDQDVDQLIKIIQSSESLGDSERVRAASVIQAAWRSHRTRTRVRNLHRAVSSLQRRYRARRRQQREQHEAEVREEELRYQVSLRRQQARRRFHLKQRRLLQLLPPEQVAPYLAECERRAAVLIQSSWRGFRDRHRFNREHLKKKNLEHRATATIQRAVRRFLERRRATRAPPSSLWIGQEGLTDRRRAELKKQVEDYIILHPSPRVSLDECRRFHDEVQQRRSQESWAAVRRRSQEQRIHALLAHTSTQLYTLREAPPLCSVTQSEAAAFLSPLRPIAARARDSHNALLWADRAPWWRLLGNEDPPGHTPLETLEAELHRVGL